MKPIAYGLLAAAFLLHSSALTASACKYCEMALFDNRPTFSLTPDSASSAPTRFPETTASVASAQTASALSSATPVIVQADQLRAARSNAVSVRQLPLTAVSATLAPVHLQTVATSKNVGVGDGSTRWMDASLLAFAVAGGLFCWKTRRTEV